MFTYALPIIAAVLVWAGFRFTGNETHAVDGLIFGAAVLAEIVLIIRSNKAAK
jgi:hypothetical protein